MGKDTSRAMPVLGELVLTALEAALEHDEPCRLMTAGRAKGLLPGGRVTSAKKQAKEQCLDPGLGFFTVTQAADGKGASAKTADFVTITSRGIESLIERRTPGERRQLLRRAANPHKEAVDDAVTRVTAADLRQIDSQQQALDKRVAELRQFMKTIVEDQLGALERRRVELKRQQDEFQGLVSGGTQASHPLGGTTPRREPLSPPVSEKDLDFQRDLCRELVFAWQDNAEPRARAALEVVMMNAGLERVGEIGETVSFDNRDHRTDSDLLPGQLAIVVQPGWQLVSARGTLLIAPVQVAASNAQGVGNAPHA
jgi:hypothetical protein